MFLSGRPLLRAGRCLFLETLFVFCHPGSPASRSNSWPLPQRQPSRPRRPGSPPGGPSTPAGWPRRVPWLLPARGPGPGPGVRSWRGGPAPAGKLESFVLAPRPARGRRGNERPAGEASGWVCGLPAARSPGPASLPTGPSAQPPLRRVLGPRHTLASERIHYRPSSWACVPHVTPPASWPSLSLPLGEMGVNTDRRFEGCL